MVKGASCTLNTWDWEKALSEPGFRALKKLSQQPFLPSGNT